MNNDAKVTVVTQLQVKSDKSHQFAQWQEMLHEAIIAFPGYISQTIMEPMLPMQPHWVLMQYFVSEDAAKNWLQSNQRQELLKTVLPLLVEIEDIYVIDKNKQGQNVAIATISTQVPAEFEQKFLDFQVKIAAVQSKFPGFLGYKLERPRSGVHDFWVVTLTFDSESHLDAWLNSLERQKFVTALNVFSGESHIEKSSRGFAFWFNPATKQNSIWKQNMLVLLTLYPVVFLLSYVQNFLMQHGMPFWLTLFLGNASSTAILGWFTVPWLMQHFVWWLEPKEKDIRKNTILGTVFVIVLYCLSLIICWLLSTFSK